MDRGGPLAGGGFPTGGGTPGIFGGPQMISDPVSGMGGGPQAVPGGSVAYSSMAAPGGAGASVPNMGGQNDVLGRMESFLRA